MQYRFHYFKAALDLYKTMSGLKVYLHGNGRPARLRALAVLTVLSVSTLIVMSPLMAQETIKPLMHMLWQKSKLQTMAMLTHTGGGPRPMGTVDQHGRCVVAVHEKPEIPMAQDFPNGPSTPLRTAKP